MMFKGLSRFSLPEIEEKVLELWRINKVFEKTLREKKGKKKENFNFYEGPPTANGKPGIHHVLARAFKDVVLRYKTMRGMKVPRRGGWDTHGLPVEIEVEKELGLSSKKEIEKYGIDKFNKKCRESVWRYKDEWERLTERMGFWIDLNNSYITYETSYIETLWWIFSQINKKNLLYKGFKIVPWCSRCGTGVSSHELALGYKSVKDSSIIAKFRIPKTKKNQEILSKITDLDINKNNLYILSWTTTPWTLPGNVALAVGDNISYTLARQDKDILVVASDRIDEVIKDNKEIIKEVKGKGLVGLEYKPLFEVRPLRTKKSHKIYSADFVNTDEGTGVVHTAVMYGEDDYALGIKEGLPAYHTVGLDGRFEDSVPDLGGCYVKEKKTEEKIINHLQESNLLFQEELYEHDYPHCWRCDTPLLYYARHSWFIKIANLRKKLINNNNKVNWVPSHIKEGRFGEWLSNAKDWAISRERYWGTPLPIWECQKCGEIKVLGSRRDLHSLNNKKNSGNKYILVRHGKAESNIENLLSCWPETRKIHLAQEGRMQADKLAQKLKKKKIDMIFSSDVTRAKETAEIIAANLDMKKIYFDERIREIGFGDFNGKDTSLYHGHYSSGREKFYLRPPKGENLSDVRKRIFDFFRSLEKRYKNKTIAVVSHEYPLWMMEAVLSGWDEREALVEKNARGNDFFDFAQAREVELKNLPRNESGEVDLHKPFIDEISINCGCGGDMKRVPEVIDVWFDSGAMPFASNEDFSSKVKESKPRIDEISDFPADYITEGIDQTRGWFYTLLAISTLLGKESPYKNVISLGLIMDKNGKKMSKSKGNTVNPWDMMNGHGIDAVRWYFYTVNQPGETKRFDEEEIKKVNRQFINIIYNCYKFYETYGLRSDSEKDKLKPSHILDKWILTRLMSTIRKATKSMDSYNITEAARAIEVFVGDLSRWYIRRSRRRFQKPKSKNDHKQASRTLEHVLLELSKLLAPFTPFFSEALYKSLLTSHGVSVHLEDWPKEKKGLITEKIITDMEEVRSIATLALKERSAAGIKVRQPLKELVVKNLGLDGKKELLNVLKEEVNVKKIVFDPGIDDDVYLNIEITHELKEEGWFREIIRIIQELRQDAYLDPKDSVALMITSSNEINHVLEKNKIVLKKEVGAQIVEFHKSEKFQAELETKIENHPLWIGIRKI